MKRLFLAWLVAAWCCVPQAMAQIAFTPADFIKKSGAVKVGKEWQVANAVIRFEVLDGIARRIEYFGSPKDTRVAAQLMLLMINNMSSVEVLEKQIRSEWAKQINLGAFKSPGRYYDVDVDWTSERLYFKVMPRELADLGQDRLIFGQSGVLMRVFSDFQCPGCKSFLDTQMPYITQRWINTGQLRYSYRHFPLSFHPEAIPAAIASECAARENKFWEFHLLLSKSFEFMIHARALKFSNAFEKCLTDPAIKQIVLSDLRIAQAQNLPATSSVLIGPFLVRDYADMGVFERYMRMARALGK